MNIIDNWEDIYENIIQDHIFIKRNINKVQIKNINNELFNEVITRVNSKYINSDIDSVLNTLHYLFYHIRSGIYVKIENNKLVAFIPFANIKYKNNWNNNIILDCSNQYNFKKNKLESYIRNRNYELNQKFNCKRYIKNIKNWWCNAFIVNNEIFDEAWGQHSLNDYKSMLEHTLENHKVNNVQFFINKRDHPLLHSKLKEPYSHMFIKDINSNPPLLPVEYFNKKFAPILSPYTNINFLDIPFIIATDWELATGNSEYQQLPQEIKWEDKIDIAIWRGSATGSPNIKNNQRLQITKLDYLFKKQNVKLIDAGIVSWNIKDKIYFDEKLNKPILTFIKINKMKQNGINLKNRIPMNEQMKYKYILNIDGHSNPNRTSYLLKSNSLLLQVESKYIVGNISWYTHLLQPYIHYIPIKYDFSDLKSQIIWCRENDSKCKQIVNNTNILYENFLSKNSICKYISHTLNILTKK